MTHTLSRVALNEWKARRRDLYPATQHSQETDIQVPGGIRNRNPTNPAAANPCLRLRGPPRSAHVRLPPPPPPLPSPPPLPLRPPLFYCGSLTRFLLKASPVFFLQSHLGPAAARQFLILTNMAVIFRTSSSHLFFGFPAGPLLPRLRSRICFGCLLSNVITICSDYFHVLTRIYVTMSACSVPLSAVCFRSHSFVLV